MKSKTKALESVELQVLSVKVLVTENSRVQTISSLGEMGFIDFIEMAPPSKEDSRHVTAKAPVGERTILLKYELRAKEQYMPFEFILSVRGTPHPVESGVILFVDSRSENGTIVLSARGDTVTEMDITAGPIMAEAALTKANGNHEPPAQTVQASEEDWRDAEIGPETAPVRTKTSPVSKDTVSRFSIPRKLPVFTPPRAVSPAPVVAPQPPPVKVG